MILPTRHIPIQESLLGLGGLLLRDLGEPTTVSSLWHTVRDNKEFRSFHQFTLALDLLFLLGAVDLTHGLLCRRASQ